jgi:hypothetical protein
VLPAEGCWSEPPAGVEVAADDTSRPVRERGQTTDMEPSDRDLVAQDVT